MSARLPCADFEPTATELALGLLVGSERSDAIDHVAGCTACRHVVEELAMVLDEVITAVPEAEPSAGFEGRVVAALAAASGDPSMATATPAERRRPVPDRRRWLRPLVAAVVLLVLALGTGVLVVARSHPTGIRTATMVGNNGSPVGEVEVGDVAGNPVAGNAGADTVRVSLPAWADDPDGSPSYLLQVELVDGTTRDLGWFKVWPQQDNWSVPLGGHAADVRRVVVLNKAGKTICHGDLL